MAEKRNCAIDALLARRTRFGAKNNRDTRQGICRWLGRTRQLAVPGSVHFGKITVNGHLQNRAAVTAAGLKALEELYQAQFLGKTEPAPASGNQPKIAFAASTPEPEGPTLVEPVIKSAFHACLDHFSEARRNFDAAILQESERVCDAPEEIEVKTVLKKLGLARLSESRVGAKATMAFKRKYPGRELAKKKMHLPNGVEIAANVWTTDEEPLLRLAALQVYAAEQPTIV